MPCSSGADDALLPLARVVIITGNYGSGKTEVAVNWTLHLARSGVGSVSIADLAVVNPYFRCREASELLGSFGVRVIVPQGEHFHSELLLDDPFGGVLLSVDHPLANAGPITVAKPRPCGNSPPTPCVSLHTVTQRRHMMHLPVSRTRAGVDSSTMRRVFSPS